MPRVSEATKAENRDRLLAAAASEFAARGLGGARIDDISLAAGLAKELQHGEQILDANGAVIIAVEHAGGIGLTGFCFFIPECALITIDASI